MKFLSVNLAKHVQDLYALSYKMLIKINKKVLNRWRYNYSHVLEHSHSKNVNSPLKIYRFNTILSNIPARYFNIDMDKVILNFIWKGKGIRIVTFF